MAAEAQAAKLAHLTDTNAVFKQTLENIDSELVRRTRTPHDWAGLPEEKRQKIIAKTKRVLIKVIADIDRRLEQRRQKKLAEGLNPDIPRDEQMAGAVPQQGGMAGLPQQMVGGQQMAGMDPAMQQGLTQGGQTQEGAAVMTNGGFAPGTDPNGAGVDPSQQLGSQAAGMAGMVGADGMPAGDPFGQQQPFAEDDFTLIMNRIQAQSMEPQAVSGFVDFEGFMGIFTQELASGQVTNDSLLEFFNAHDLALSGQINLDEITGAANPEQSGMAPTAGGTMPMGSMGGAQQLTPDGMPVGGSQAPMDATPGMPGLAGGPSQVGTATPGPDGGDAATAGPDGTMMEDDAAGGDENYEVNTADELGNSDQVPMGGMEDAGLFGGSNAAGGGDGTEAMGSAAPPEDGAEEVPPEEDEMGGLEDADAGADVADEIPEEDAAEEDDGAEAGAE